jgi:hypothetical protein
MAAWEAEGWGWAAWATWACDASRRNASCKGPVNPGLCRFGRIQRPHRVEGTRLRRPRHVALRNARVRPIVTGRVGNPEEPTMSHQPPKQNKKKPQHTAKEKKTIKQQKKHASDQAPFIKNY